MENDQEVTFAEGDAVTVNGPQGSTQAGKAGVVKGTHSDLGHAAVEVLLEGEQRPRNFRPEHLVKE